MKPYKHNKEYINNLKEEENKLISLTKVNHFIKGLLNINNKDSFDVHKKIGLSSNKSPERIEDILTTIENYKNNDLNHKTNFIKIMEDLKVIHETLKPLESILKLKFDISLVGGSVRDLILGNSDKISDLDVLISINSVDLSQSSEKRKYENNLKNLKDGNYSDLIIREAKSNDDEMEEAGLEYLYNFDKEIKELNIPEFVFNPELKTKRLEQFFFHVIKSIVKKDLNIEHEFPPLPIMGGQNEDVKVIKNILVEDYLNMLLRGVLKLKDSKLNYPVDILIGNIETSRYVDAFDFNICKASFTVYNGYGYAGNIKDDSVINNINKYIETKEDKYFSLAAEEVYCEESFLDDMVDKKITFDAEGFSIINALAHSAEKHYPRIKAKYPDFKFDIQRSILKYEKEDIDIKNIILDDFKEHIQPEKKNYLYSFIKYLTLKETLGEKNDYNNPVLVKRKL